MRWRIEVSGNSFDLENVERAVAGLHAEAFSDGDKTFLYAEAFEHMGTAEDVYRTAERLIATVNASLRLSDFAAEPLAVGVVVGANGSTHFVMAAETATLRLRVGAVTMIISGGAIREPPGKSLLAKRTRLIDSDPEVAKAVSFLNVGDETLGSLAKAFEIVKGDLGQGDHRVGGKRAAALSGSRSRTFLAFMDNVAHPTLSGDLSRHTGRNKDRQPKATARQMSHAEATALVRRVVLAWIDAKQ
jgi:hypothetical protein